MDDAAITFAYARNAVEGLGVVAFPGDLPVEGFTNLMWFVLIAGLIQVGAFDPVWSTELLAVACASGAFLAPRRAAVRTHSDRTVGIDLGLLLLALNPAFAIWCASGLENSLNALLVAILVQTGGVGGGRGAHAPSRAQRWLRLPFSRS